MGIFEMAEICGKQAEGTHVNDIATSRKRLSKEGKARLLQIWLLRDKEESKADRKEQKRNNSGHCIACFKERQMLGRVIIVEVCRAIEVKHAYTRKHDKTNDSEYSAYYF